MQPLGDHAAECYRAALEFGSCDTAMLARETRLSEAELSTAVQELQQVGLVGADLKLATPPHDPLVALAHSLEEQALVARLQAAELTNLWERHRGDHSPLEYLREHDAIFAAQRTLVTNAREFRAFSKGPQSRGGEAPKTSVAPGFFDAMKAGARFKVIYDSNVLRYPDRLEMVAQCMAAGEESRVSPSLPFNLQISDSNHVLLYFNGSGENRAAAVLIRPSGLADVLAECFEIFWRSSVPFTLNADGGIADTNLGNVPDAATRKLLHYLNAGLTDESIAREFNISERTLRRRITRLQEMLGASTRFQLGSKAAQEGWVTSSGRGGL